ncbi:MAG TPA: protein kinase [bacterium]|nr:protein kinase [bacterium]
MPRYHRVEMLGQGATGVVYKAVDTQTDALLALKVPPEEAVPADYPKYQAVYTAEAGILGLLNHPVIMALRGQGNDDGTPYIAYEYIRGQALRTLIAAGQVFQPAQVAALLGELLEAVAYLHGERVIHRDINPNNLVLLPEGPPSLKLIDFGSAVRLGQPTGQLVGTPQYMAPEQLKGNAPDPRSDLFSVGVVAYELLTGQPPFVGNSFPELLQTISAGQFTPATARNRALPPAIDSFFRTALATDPATRFQSAPAMRAALNTALGLGALAPTMHHGTPSLAEVAAGPDPAVADVPLVEEGATLVGVEGPYTGEKFPLSGGITTLGGPYADIDLSRDLAIAAQHAWIVYEADRYSLHDADESGGTRLNRQWIKRAPLLDGDIIEVGGSSFRFNDPHQPVGAGRPAGSVEYARPPDSQGGGGGSATSRRDNVAEVVERQRSRASGLLTGLLVLLLLAASAIGVAAVVVPGQIRNAMTNELDTTWEEMGPVLRATNADQFLAALELYDPDVNAQVLANIDVKDQPYLAWLPPVEAAALDAELMLEMTRNVNEALLMIKKEDNSKGLTPGSSATVNAVYTALSTFRFDRPPWPRRLAQASALFNRLASAFPKPVPAGAEHPINPYLTTFSDGLKAYEDKDFKRAFTLLDEALVGVDQWYSRAPSAQTEQVMHIGAARAADVARVVMAICEIREAQMRLIDDPAPSYTQQDLDTIKEWLRDAGRLLRQVDPPVLEGILEDLSFPTGTDHRTFEDQIDVLEDNIDTRKQNLGTGGPPSGAFN